jgi:hypothetical protein
MVLGRRCKVAWKQEAGEAQIGKCSGGKEVRAGEKNGHSVLHPPSPVAQTHTHARTRMSFCLVGMTRTLW